MIAESLDLETREFISASLQSGGDYFEWGCGASTVFAATRAQQQIVSVENDPLWCELVKSELNRQTEITAKRVKFELINLGPVKKWGYPESLVTKSQSESYYQLPFKRFQLNRDTKNRCTILVDGRFRKSCALTVFLEGNMDFSLVIDDACNRPHLMEFAEIIGGGWITVGRSLVWQSPTFSNRELLVNLQDVFAQDQR
jgi:hypothetical protein